MTLKEDLEGVLKEMKGSEIRYWRLTGIKEYIESKINDRGKEEETPKIVVEKELT